MSNKDQLSSQLAELENRFRDRLRAELAEMADAAKQVLQGESNDPRSHLVLRDRLHKLAGSAGTFGYNTLGSACRELEVQLQQQIDKPPADETLMRRLAEHIIQLDSLLIDKHETLPQAPSMSDESHIPNADRHIALVVGEQELAQQMSQTLTSFGYQISQFSEPAELFESLDSLDAVIIDTSTGEWNAQELTEKLRSTPDSEPLPLLVISSDDSFNSRLASVRAGARGFFTKPVDLPSLESRLERSFTNHQAGPFRVLIIDDDTELAARYALILTSAGMLVESEFDPELLLEKMHAFGPDVVLMDINMPDFSGPELAQVIRLNDDWLRVPIIYLSAETNAERQMSALLKAGDDFITKPISDSALLTTVYARAQRARMVSDALSRDSLTGLLKHADIKDQLDIEIGRAQRSQQPVSIAMIDIDHFKSVNDQYGHPVGDNVIRALSNLLRQRLRKIDRLGRYGGEEFLAVLPNCSIEDAQQILDEIRAAFAALNFSADEHNFNCTFSTGISACTADDWPSDGLLDLADRRLYQAKKGGRNQVCSESE